ncbi:hypothetical protein RM531_09885 [Salinisphaera sp. P385]|uniref:Delta-60 repeat domain-containing protein n=1 Tax=Spectribacter acetivorans TaxID=3075603 RepID=A0ABU3BAC4_9GAMM|nr:hypothetical protein [Salinisphaera sp. P385]MDT0618782.1 hypothetical protein [Salinisphaera sp. P385]
MNMTHLGRGAAAIVLPTFLFACGGSSGGGGNGGGDDMPQDPPEQFTVIDNDTTRANGINGIVHASNGGVYAIGFSDQQDQRTVILAYDADGDVDETFGDNGVMSLNVRVAGQGMGSVSSGDEQGFGIVQTAEGDLVIAVNAADGNGEAELDEGQSVYLFRLDSSSDFAVDTEFGDDGGSNGLLEGAQEVVFATPNTDNSSYQSTVGVFPVDAASDLLLDTSQAPDERLVVLGAGSAPVSAGATDQDRYVARLMADTGMADNSFRGGSAHQYTTPRGPNSGDNVRRGFVEADGSIMSAGYTDLGDGFGNHIILIKLQENGQPDPGFGDFIDPSMDSIAGVSGPGIAAFNPFRDVGGFAEAYGAVPQSNGEYITTGYGAANNGTRPPSDDPLSEYLATDGPDVVTFRVAGDTMVDEGYGNPNASGTQAFQSETTNDFTDDQEVSGEDRGRDMVVLPDDTSVHVGYYGGVPAIYVVTPDGQLDTTVDDDGLILLPHDDIQNTSGPVTQQFFTVEATADGSRLAMGTRGNDDAGARVVIVDLEPEE